MAREHHHIVPLSQGGTNETSNLISLSPTAHAIISLFQSRHYGECCMHRRQRKFLPPELLELADYWFNEQAKKANEKLQQKLSDSYWKHEFGEKVSKGLTNYNLNFDNYLKTISNAKIQQPLATEAAMSEKSKQKRKETFEKIKHQQGPKNSQHGTMWVTDGKTNKKIKKDNQIPEGYKRGRTL